MKIWKLTPVDPEHNDWDASRYSGMVIVRAESEERAREFVIDRFKKGASKSAPGDKIKVAPWKQPDAVSVVEVKDGGYSKTGKEEILDPEEARAYNDS